MNKKNAISIVALLLIGIIIYAVSRRESKHGSDQSSVVIPAVDTNTTQPVTRASVNPVSLPALMQKKYDGRDLQLGRVLEENSVYTRYFITYKSGDLSISGIMNIPKGTGPFPVLVLDHGYIDPAVYTNGRGLRREQDYFARHGYAVLHTDYRNHAQSDTDPTVEQSLRLGYVEDAINAVMAIKQSSLAAIDKNNIGMVGHSMGGGVAINVMVVQPDLVKAVVLYAPVSATMEDNFNRWTITRPEVAAKIIELHGSPADKPEFWKNVSAVNFLDRVNVPVRIFHGTNDQSVPYEWSQQLERNLTNQKKNSVLVTFPGEAHEFGPSWVRFMEQSTAFFDEFVK